MKRKAWLIEELSSEESEGWVNPKQREPPLKQRKLNTYKFVSSGDESSSDEQDNEEEISLEKQKPMDPKPNMDHTVSSMMSLSPESVSPVRDDGQMNVRMEEDKEEREEQKEEEVKSEEESDDSEDVSMVDYRVRKTEVYLQLHFCERAPFRDRVRAMASSPLILALEMEGKAVDLAVLELVSLFASLKEIYECERCPNSKIVHRCGLADSHFSLCSKLTSVAKKRLSKAQRNELTDFNRYRRQLKAINNGGYWMDNMQRVDFSEPVSEIKRKLQLRRGLFTGATYHRRQEVATKYIPNLMNNVDWLKRDKVMDQCVDQTRYAKIKSSSMIVCQECLTSEDTPRKFLC